MLPSLGLDADSWRSTITAAAPLMLRAHLAAIDLVGHGAFNDTPFTLDIAADGVIVAAHGLGAREPLHLVGSGLGALVALHIATRQPSMVASMVLAGWPPTPTPPGQSRADLVANALSTDGAKVFADNYLEQIGTIAEARSQLSTAMVRSSAHGLVQGIAAAEAWTPATTLISPHPPTLIIHGAQDIRTSAQSAHQFADAVGAQFLSIEGAGHLAYVDRPRPFAVALAEFHAGLA